ncbi:Aminomethyltransferase [Devosia equisanguinis]|uniref:aminomethyltransferase n=2 Tax=Devosiaceae TaxID=2831106 RepID=A0A3S4D4A2_9HYPH|nr:Aminomethyltransferase [Devosia equisanguinis]
MSPSSQREFMAEASTEDLKQTPLYDRHVAAGGRIVPFGGYALPVQYPTGIMAEHKWTREQAGLFDVSHMGPSFLTLTNPSGDAEADHAAIAAVIEPLISGDIAGLKPGQMRYTLLLNDTGGAVDDLMVGRSPTTPGSLLIVVNAGTKENDFAIIAKAAGDKAILHRADDGGLLALQGPEAVNVMSALVPDAAQLGFMQYGRYEWNGVKATISRSGYTGEDGFEILVPGDNAAALWDALLADPRVKPIGLGARDSLRLEAGLPLYGHDLDETVSPIEADLGFAVSKRRREAADFPGASRILAERQGELSRKRIGLLVEGAPAREGAEILDADGNAVGIVTSGGFAPSIGRAIALGFVPPALSDIGTALQVSVRGRAQKAEVVALPFVPHRYFRKSA